MFWNSSESRPFFSDPGSHFREGGVSSPGLCPEAPATAGWLPQLMAGGGQTSQAAPQAGGGWGGSWLSTFQVPEESVVRDGLRSGLLSNMGQKFSFLSKLVCLRVSVIPS